MSYPKHMGIRQFLKYIFSIDTKSTNRVIIYILGIKIRFLKPEFKNSVNEYLGYKVTEIPKATGVLRKIQFANLKLMQIFDSLCKENNLSYWLDFGNLLGAVRHKGFIPWDDDVDMGMMRDDYEKFIELFKDGIPNYPDLYITFNNNGKNKCFVKLLHKNLPNIQIDLFPYDFYYKQLDNDEKTEVTKKLKSVMNRPLYKLIFLFFLNRPNAMRKRFYKIRTKEILKNNTVLPEDKPAIFCGIDYPHSHKYLVSDYETIFPLKQIEYENMLFSCPNNEDILLKQEFGDYMQLPKDCYSRHCNSENSIYEKDLDKFINN